MHINIDASERMMKVTLLGKLEKKGGETEK